MVYNYNDNDGYLEVTFQTPALARKYRYVVRGGARSQRYQCMCHGDTQHCCPSASVSSRLCITMPGCSTLPIC